MCAQCADELFRHGTVSVDQSIINGRLNTGFYDHEEVVKATAFMKKFKLDMFNKAKDRRGGLSDAQLLDTCVKMTFIVRDLMTGNPKLADAHYAKKWGFTSNVEYAQGANAIVAGTQGQRQWTDYNPNFDVKE